MEGTAVSSPYSPNNSNYDARHNNDESIFSSVHNLSDSGSIGTVDESSGTTSLNDSDASYEVNEPFEPNAQSSPLNPSIHMVDRSIQLDDDFIATNDWCKQNHWKIQAFEFLYVELFIMLNAYNIKLRQDVQYPPRAFMRLLWELLSRLSSKEEEANAEVSRLKEAGAKLEDINKKITDMILQCEEELIYVKRESAYYQRHKMKIEAELEGALAIIQYLEDPSRSDNQLTAEADLQGQMVVADFMINNLEDELVEVRSKNESFERKLSNANWWRLRKEQQDLVDASQNALAGEDILEKAINSSLESSGSVQSLTGPECYKIIRNFTKNMKDAISANHVEITRLLEDMKTGEEEISRLNAEKSKLNEKICELDLQVKNLKNLIRIYEDEIDPYERQIREWNEYIERRREYKADTEGPWSPYLPNMESGFLPGDFSSPQVAEKGFIDHLPGVPREVRNFYGFRSPDYGLLKQQQQIQSAPHQSPIRSSTPEDQQTDSRFSQRRGAITPQGQIMSTIGLPRQSPIRSPKIQDQHMVSRNLSSQSPTSSQFFISDSPVTAPLVQEDISLPSFSDTPDDQIIGSTGLSPRSPRISAMSPVEGSAAQGLFDAENPIQGTPRTPVAFPRSRFRYTNPETEIFNRRPTPSPSVHDRVLLLSPNREEPLVLDVDIQPQPLRQTASGEHLICNIALNMRDPTASDAHNIVPRPMRKEFFGIRARQRPDAVGTSGTIPVTPSVARDYPFTPKSVLVERRFAHRNLFGTEKPSATEEPKLEKPRLDQSMDWQLVSI